MRYPYAETLCQITLMVTTGSAVATHTGALPSPQGTHSTRVQLVLAPLYRGEPLTATYA
jgi:hypothetical protein